jgi:hypothetical protein
MNRCRVPAGHQVEGAVSEGQGRVLVVGDDDDAKRVQQLRRLGEVGWPALGRDHRGREALGSCAGQHLAAARLDVQRRGRQRQPLTEQTLKPPRRTLLGGSTLEPGEVPALDRHRSRLGHQLVERPRHVDISA